MRKKKKSTSIFKIRTKDPDKMAKEFAKTVKTGQGNLGKGFFKV